MTFNRIKRAVVGEILEVVILWRLPVTFATVEKFVPSVLT
jgi:hypothetical protein